MSETTYHIASLGWIDAGDRPADERRLRWSDFSDRPFDRFGRLDLLSQYALAAAERAGVFALAQTPAGAAAPLVFATTVGCGQADVAFAQSMDQPGGPSPLLFPCTLPSTPVAAITLAYQLHGPSVCLMHDASSVLGVALDEAMSLLDEMACVQQLPGVVVVADATWAIAVVLQRQPPSAGVTWTIARESESEHEGEVIAGAAALAHRWRAPDTGVGEFVIPLDASQSQRLVVRCCAK